MHVAKKKTLTDEHVSVVGLAREKRSWGEFWLTNVSAVQTRRC